jgi:hypothetical protein
MLTMRLQVLADASAAFADAGVDAQVVLERVARVTAEPLRAGCIIRLRADDPQWLDAVTIYDRNPARAGSHLRRQPGRGGDAQRAAAASCQH